MSLYDSLLQGEDLAQDPQFEKISKNGYNDLSSYYCGNYSVGEMSGSVIPYFAFKTRNNPIGQLLEFRDWSHMR